MVTEGNREISFVIERYLGVLSEAQNGWKKELNLVSWNDKPAKLDIREWSPDHQRMAKGVTLRHEEARLLQRALYRWLTGYGKPQEPAAPADTVLVEPETGEILETPAEMVELDDTAAEEVFCCPAEEPEIPQEPETPEAPEEPETEAAAETE